MASPVCSSNPRNMFARIVSILWGLLPRRFALAIWRAVPPGNLPMSVRDPKTFPSLVNDVRWSVSEALAYRRCAEAGRCLSADDERLLRLIEIRKERFFNGVPCEPAAVLASTMADLGERFGDLRLINTALKLRDIAVCSFPPFGRHGPTFFHDADSKIESTLRRLRHDKA